MPTVTLPPPPKRGAKVTPLVKRNRALENIRVRYQFKHYAIGTNDCTRMIRRLLVAMGHKNLPNPKPYKTALGAKRELTRLGFKSLEVMMDTLLPRITPAEMLAGDIALVEADPDDAAGDETLVVSIGMSDGKHKFWGWHPDQPEFAQLVIDPNDIKAAWRT